MSEAAAEAPTSSAPRRRLRRWREPQLWRLGSGLVLFVFALTHFLNHALGLVSLDAMEAVQQVRSGFWRTLPGTVLLYGALAVHVALSAGKLLRRRSWRLPPWEVAQISLGLAIPFLAVAHVTATRGMATAVNFDDSYGAMLRILWPNVAFNQSLLLIIVWLHSCIGLHNWLRVYPAYGRAAPLLLVAAVLVPTLALAGWIEAARRLALKDMPAPETPMAHVLRQHLTETATLSLWTIAGLMLAVFAVWRAVEWFRTGPTISYVGGRKVRATAGATLLEISRSAGVPHASVCGGRGRCTTCRVMVLQGLSDLAPPNATEAAALRRIDAPPGVRLACQIRPEHAITVRPLIPLRDAEPAVGRDAYRWGVERRITVMFADLRGFTTLAERLYPYDSVFLLNRYFEVMTQAIERHNGEVDKFLGDGIMALFGLSARPGAGSADSLDAARAMLAALDDLNDEFDATLSQRLRMGIGLHTGQVVLGRVGGRRTAELTALGDTVNIASRLESLNKEYGSCLVASEAVVEAAGRKLRGEVHEVSVRGRAEPLRVMVVKSLAELQDAQRFGTAGR